MPHPEQFSSYLKFSLSGVAEPDPVGFELFCQIRIRLLALQKNVISNIKKILNPKIVFLFRTTKFVGRKPPPPPPLHTA